VSDIHVANKLFKLIRLVYDFEGEDKEIEDQVTGASDIEVGKVLDRYLLAKFCHRGISSTSNYNNLMLLLKSSHNNLDN
jgi:hypothetical protein